MTSVVWETALLRDLNDIFIRGDEGSVLIMFKLSVAFDTVDHTILNRL